MPLKQRYSKVIAAMLVLTILFLQFPPTAFAASPIASVGGTQHYSITTAWVSAISKRQPIILLADWNTQSHGMLTVPSGVYLTIDLNNYKINRGLQGSSSYTNTGSVFYVEHNSTLTLKNGTVTGGHTSRTGGGVYVYGGSTLNLQNVTISGNKTTTTYGSGGYGGGVILDGTKAVLNMKNSHIISNYAYQDGGGVYMNGDDSVINMDKTSTINSNTADGYGGGVYADNHGSKIVSGNISYNTSALNGGGVYGNSYDLTIQDTTISHNYTKGSGNGGGVYVAGKTSAISGCAITNNSANGGGGGIFGDASGLTISGCSITNNTAGTFGGGVYQYSSSALNLSGTVKIKDNTVSSSKSNLYLSTATITGPPSPNSRIGISVSENASRKLSYEAETYNTYSFTSDISGMYCIWDTKDRFLYLKAGSAPTISVTTIDNPTPVKTKDTISEGGVSYPVYKGYTSFPSNTDPGKDLDVPFFYSDGYFAKPPSVYNAHLATMSANMALAAFGSSKGDTVDYSNKFTNIKQLLLDIGCDSDKIFVNDAFTKKPTENSIGVVIGQKELLNPTNNTPTGEILIPIAIRGGGYESEWASNVTLGLSGEATGFNDSATQVVTAVNQYIKNNPGLSLAASSGKVKFWVVGFSRAGAVANLTAKRLIDSYDSNNKLVYGYTIEAPQGGYSPYTPGTNRYEGIHNIINSADLVPMVGPKEMGFIRYGIDHYVPGGSIVPIEETVYTTPSGIKNTTFNDNHMHSTNSSAYFAQREKMRTQLGYISDTFVFDDYFHLATINYVNYGLGLQDLLTETGSSLITAERYLPKFFEMLQKWTFASEGTDYRKFYSEKKIINNVTGVSNQSIQTTLQHATKLIFTKSSADVKNIMNALGGVSDNIGVYSIWKNVVGNWDNLTQSDKAYYLKHLWDALMVSNGAAPCVGDYLTAAERAMLYEDWPVLGDILFRFLSVDYTVKGNAIDSAYATSDEQIMLGTFLYNSSRLLLPHYQEVPLAWLRSYDSYYENENGAYDISAQKTPEPATASLNSGDLFGDQTLILSSETPGSSIYYSINGSSYQLYQNPIALVAPSDTFPITYKVTYYSQYFGEKSQPITSTYKIGKATYTLTFNDNGTTKVTSHKVGELITLKANPPEGMRFGRWDGIGISFGDPRHQETSFKMPERDVVANTNYIPKSQYIWARLYPLTEHETSPQPIPKRLLTYQVNGAHTVENKNPDYPYLDSIWFSSPASWYVVGDDGSLSPATTQRAAYNTLYQLQFTIPKSTTAALLNYSKLAANIMGEEAKVKYDPSDESVVVYKTYTRTPKAKLTQALSNPSGITVYSGVELTDLPLPKTISINTEDGAKVADILWSSDKYDNSVAGYYTLTGTLDLDALGIDADTYSPTVTTNVTVQGKEVAASPVVTSNNPSTSASTQTIKLSTKTSGAAINYTLSVDGTAGAEIEYDDSVGIVLAAPMAGVTTKYDISAYTKSTNSAAMDDSSPVIFSYTIATPLPKYMVTINYFDTGLNQSAEGGISPPTTHTYTQGEGFAVTAPDLENKVFDYWETGDATNPTKNPERTIVYENGITEDINLRAVYNPIIRKLDFTVTAPVAGKLLPEKVTECLANDYPITYLLDDIVWITPGFDATYNTSHRAGIILKEYYPVVGPRPLKFHFADDLVITAKNGGVAQLYLDPEADGHPAVQITFPPTEKAKLLSITPPTSMSLAHGETLSLPTTVQILAEDNSITHTSVTWDSTSYDSSKLTRQILTFNGTVDLPDTLDQNGVSLKVSQSVVIAGAPYVEPPVATLQSGQYTRGRSIMLTSKTDDADIFYTTDGTMPTTSSTKYTEEITLDGDISISTIAFKAGMQPSSASVYTYTVVDKPDTSGQDEEEEDLVASALLSSNTASEKLPLSLAGTVATLLVTDEQLAHIFPVTGALGTVELDISTFTADTVVIPKKLINAALLATDANGIKVIYKGGSVTISQQAIASLSGDDVKLTLKTQDGSTLSDIQKKSFGALANQATVLHVTAYVGNTQVTTFSSGDITVAAPYHLQPEEIGKNISLWHITPSGGISPVSCVYKEDGVTFTTNKTGTYALTIFPFTDVSPADWYYSDVFFAYARGLFSGTGGSSFSPDQAMTRGMLTTVLWRMAGQPKSAVGSFVDVAPDKYYSDAVSWAAANKIVLGNNGYFAPDDAVTREQLATILHRYAKHCGLDVSVGENTNILSYNDAFSISQYAISAMQWVCGASILQGDQGNLMPKDISTRGQVAAILHRFTVNVTK